MTTDFTQKKFSTGEFAAIYNINKKTLMYYDDINLFKPSFVAKNGYRYYTFNQTALFDLIILLRKLRTPLKEIKQLLSTQNIEEELTFLDKQQKKITKEIDENLWLQKVIKNKINILKNYKATRSKGLTIQYLKKRAIIISNELNYSKPMENNMKILNGFIQNCYQEHTYTGYPFGYILNAKKINNEALSFDSLSNYFLYVDESHPKTQNNFTYQPQGKYLVDFFQGEWDKMDDYLYNCIKSAEKQNLKIAGPIYLETLAISSELGTLSTSYPFDWEGIVYFLLDN